jgi:hypothetical protein
MGKGCAWHTLSFCVASFSLQFNPLAQRLRIIGTSFAVCSTMSIFRIEQMDMVFRQIQPGFSLSERWLRRRQNKFKGPKRIEFKLKNQPMSVIGMHIAANALCQKFWIG